MLANMSLYSIYYNFVINKQQNRMMKVDLVEKSILTKTRSGPLPHETDARIMPRLHRDTYFAWKHVGYPGFL